MTRYKPLLETEKNAGYEQFLPFPKLFSEASFLRVVKMQDCVEGT